MPTTFNAISIGQLTDIDSVEGNFTAENANALVGMTFGGPGDALVDDFVEISEAGNVGSAYNMNNAQTEQFSVDGGGPQTFDGTSVYNATITYTDGSTANYTAVVFQDVNGNTYLAPEFSNNADQASLEADSIQSISLDSLLGNTYSGMTASREEWDFVTCFVRGTRIETMTGLVAIEDLKLGDLVRTVDNGFVPLRWVGSKTVDGQGTFAPILIRKGALGNTRDLRVSPQHRILMRDWRAQVYVGSPDALAAAKHLVNGDTILPDPCDEVEYFHIMFDHHELVFAAGIASESFNPGHLGWGALAVEAREEILMLFPELRERGLSAYGPAVRPSVRAHEAQLLST